jgi:phosphatidylserine/phosphatidylglycerophosphate/cardiolipin synthase-like enzyme
MTIDSVMTDALCHKLRSDTNAKDSFGVFVLLDLGNVEEPACARQHEAMLSMHKWGVKFRARKPNPCFASIHHDKAWLFDRHLIILGSANATHNSHNNCSESDLGTRDPIVIQEFEARYDRMYALANEIDWDQIREHEATRLAAIRVHEATRLAKILSSIRRQEAHSNRSKKTWHLIHDLHLLYKMTHMPESRLRRNLCLDLGK